MRLKKKVLFSPDKTSHTEAESYMCGFFRKHESNVKLFHDHYFIPFNFNENYIDWPGKPSFTWSYDLPKVIWNGNHQVDIYVNTKIKSGEFTEHQDGKVFDYHGNKLSEYPLDIIIHYEREGQ